MGTHTVGLDTYALILLKVYSLLEELYCSSILHGKKKKDVNYRRSREVE